MAEPRPMASLTSSLLARKGAARPAMRPQVDFAPVVSRDAAHHAQAEDLGWNDFGHQASEPHPAPQAAAMPAPAVPPAPEVVPISLVRQHQQAIAARLGAGVETTPRRSALEQGRRAAFTLRLDADRHLALRLAATISGRSAQQVVTEALDRLLAERPEVAALASQIGTAQIQQPQHAPNSQRGNEK